MERMTRWITSRRYLLLLLEHLVSNPITEILLTVIIRITGRVLSAVLVIMRVVFRMTLEDITVLLMKLPLIRVTTLKVMTMLKPIMKGIEPEGLWLFREVMRVRGVKDVIMPVVMSTGVLLETLAEPEVVNELGKKEVEE
ncbi:MAG TPA: hypothetical protein G4O13_02335 [Dehalococcoidia bacterium]|nr:hypothetical protein [Dehalococcoidia bacterium]